MLIEILRRTPPWVFVLFFVLLAFGLAQSRNRVVGRGMVPILPAAMMVLSFYGVLSAFGGAAIGLVAWALGVAIAVSAGARLMRGRGVAYSVERRSFSIPGSWLPLTLMMAIFFMKYAVGVVTARQLPIAHAPAFPGAVSLCYGLFSGLFLARAMAIWRVAARTVPGAG